MAVPKRKTSKSKIGMRRGGSTHKKQLPGTVICKQCGESHIPHRVCKACGSYRGRQVLTISHDE